MKNKCPICNYELKMCQCLFAGDCHPDRTKIREVILDHLYLLTGEQIKHIQCRNCLFNDSKDCDKGRREWAESEYVEKLVISKIDKAFLEYTREECKYMARDEDGRLYVYSSKPFKEKNYWHLHSGCCSGLNFAFAVDFPMVKWSDEEPWSIEDLKKLEVVDSYE